MCWQNCSSTLFIDDCKSLFMLMIQLKGTQNNWTQPAFWFLDPLLTPTNDELKNAIKQISKISNFEHIIASAYRNLIGRKEFREITILQYSERYHKQKIGMQNVDHEKFQDFLKHNCSQQKSETDIQTEYLRPQLTDKGRFFEQTYQTYSQSFACQFKPNSLKADEILEKNHFHSLKKIKNSKRLLDEPPDVARNNKYCLDYKLMSQIQSKYINRRKSQDNFHLREIEPVGKFDYANELSIQKNLTTRTEKKLATTKNPATPSGILKLTPQVLTRLDKKHLIEAYLVPKKFKDLEQEQRYNQKRLAAYAFCTRGYGVSRMREEVATGYHKVKIDQRRYKTVAGAFITQSFRRLEQFLINNCEIQLTQLRSKELKSLHTYLLNGSATLPPSLCNTFKKFIHVTYGFTNQLIAQREAISFYQHCLDLVEDKRDDISQIGKSMRPISQQLVTKLPNPHRGETNKMVIRDDMFDGGRLEAQPDWSANLDNDLIIQYSQRRKISQIRDYFRFKYNTDYTISKIKNRLRKILRYSLRKLQSISRRLGSGLPTLVPLIDQSVSYLLQNTGTVNLRVWLLEVYRNHEVDEGLVVKLIQRINSSVITKAKGRQSKKRMNFKPKQSDQEYDLGDFS